MDFQHRMNCRLCDKDISGSNGLLLFDYTENVETTLGRKINIILNTSNKQEKLSNYCCKGCSSKIETCFSLLVEIQASDEVIRQTYEILANGKKIDTATQLFICGECKTTVSGIKSFIKHYENHILKHTTVGSKKDITVPAAPLNKLNKGIEVQINSNCKNVKENNDFLMHLKANNITENFSSHVSNEFEKAAENKESDASEYLEADFNADNDFQNAVFSCENKFDDNEKLILEDNDTTSQLSENESNDAFDLSLVDSDESDSQLEGTIDNNTSYKSLVEIVKKELVKSDSEEETSDLIPNKNGTYSCESCNLSFEYKFILKLHLQKDHKAFHDLDIAYIKQITQSLEENESESKCCYCNKKFSPSELKMHVFNCKSIMQNRGNLCQVCGKMCRSLEKHMEEHKKTDGWTCDLCNKNFKNKRLLKRHLREHDESRKKMCEFCGQKVLPLSFFSHIMKHREKRHVCQYCGKAFSYNYGLRLHLRIHENQKLEARPVKKKDKVFCWLCKKDFNCTVTLNKHLKNDHNTEGVEQDSRFSCSQCDKKFADMFSLKAHLKLIHEMKDEDIARLKSLPVYRYIECNVCNKVFNSENKIRIHMKQDHGLKPFEMEILKKECEKCGKKFASKQNLIHHINGAHLHIKPMTCDVCQEKFSKHSSLIYHKLRHSGEKPFQCEFCRKSYRQRNDVIRHLARHVRDKELTLEEASAVNNSPSRLVIKRRIFLKDSSINYQTIVRKSRRKSEIVEMEPIIEEEINEIQEEQMEFNESGISDSMIYVEEVPVDENQPGNSSEIQFINTKPVYNEERNTIILSSPEVLKHSVKNVTIRYFPTQSRQVPAVIVKKEEHL